MKNSINNVSIDILINGKSVKQFSHQGKSFIIGHKNAEYEILIKNNNNYRVAAQIGIDGINVINGQPNKDKSGSYIINSWSSLHLKGYRISDNEVAAFKFVDRNSSYATEKARKKAQNGVITLSVYDEYIAPSFNIGNNDEINNIPYIPYMPYKPWKPIKPYVYPYDIWYNNTSSRISSPEVLDGAINCRYLSNCEGNVPSEEFSLGSTFGSKIESKVVETDFKYGNYLGEINIYYSTKENLKKMGVEIENQNKVVFPVGSNNKYCSPPKNWS